MSEQTTTIVSKVWGMCNPLRDDGVSYGDYLEQLTYLIGHFQKDEISKLFQIISIGNAVIPEGIAQTPDLGDYG